MAFAIQTKYIPPSNTKEAHVRAISTGGEGLFDYDSSHTLEENHAAAAKALCEKLHWPGEFFSGVMKNGDYAHVLH